MRQRLNTLGEPADPAHVDTALWRALPIGQLIEDTIAGVRQDAARVFEEVGDRRLEQIAGSQPPTKRRGPKPSLTPELLARVVAPAFATGGRRTVEAVRAALQDAGYPGSGPDGNVTIDQARKAVTKARAEGLIAPAKRSSR